MDEQRQTPIQDVTPCPACPNFTNGESRLPNTFRVVLAVGVPYRGCAAPVVWKVLKAGEKQPRKPEWQALLLASFQGVVPTGWCVVALADRGLYAKWLFEAAQQMGRHPLLRVNKGGSLRPGGAAAGGPSPSWFPPPVAAGRGAGRRSKAPRPA